jgi:broad specificity phosphatase PhoE
MIKNILNKLLSFINKEKTYKIILVRHGESEGNVDPSLYMKIPDHKIKLTNRGQMQAENAGKLIKKIIKNHPLDVYFSPYQRTIETWKGIKKGLNRNNLSEDEDLRLREQQHTMFRSEEHRRKKFKEQKEFSKVFYRFGKGGESVADVYSRIQTFLTELRLDKKVFNHENDCIIVAHEIVLKCMLMKFYKISTNEYGKIPDIENCSPIVLETKNFKTAKIIENFTIGNLEIIDFFKNKNKI